jgi:molybdopterin/thiamine biosynthesis adenylyltransferase/rhodanese-related sulfurtransferase
VIPLRPDYSRQVLLKEIGAAGQALLAKSRVLVVGAGGLGSPVLQYLAGAGVGTLGVIDADRLAASNLHRQPLYALADVGLYKVELARAAVAALNPEVHVEAYSERFHAGNALALVASHDVVVDCTDNFRAKYLINDAAVLTQRPAVFASVYQYEGQLQVYKPEPGHACLRCSSADAPADGVVGNCAEAGVLGPVPGAIGALQGLLTLKILLHMAGQLEQALLLLDFADFSTTKIKARRHTACQAPHCTRIQGLRAEPADLEIALDSLQAASAQGFTVIDIRNDDEVAARPSGARHIPMGALLADPSLLPGGPIVLLCASGKRSASAAQALAERGIAVRSLAGGLPALRNPLAI